METALYVLSMLCVGFIEELIFRGFLFKAMAKDGIKSAIIVSSITFGLGHIINLVNGAELLPTPANYLCNGNRVFFLLCCFIRGNVCALYYHTQRSKFR